MKIWLKNDWKSRVFDKIKIYSLNLRDRQLINQIFDELHNNDKLFWINVFIFFNYSIFCVWKILFFDERKNRVVIKNPRFERYNSIRRLFRVVTIKYYINRTRLRVNHDNKLRFFYQWRMHFIDRHQLTIINHEEQIFFNVIVMNYKNSSTYIQRQINWLLRFHCKHAKVYVDDIVIFSKILKSHKQHFRVVFDTFQFHNIFVKITKTFDDYFNIQLFNQTINFFEFVIVEDKFKAIIKFKFSTSFY